MIGLKYATDSAAHNGTFFDAEFSKGGNRSGNACHCCQSAEESVKTLVADLKITEFDVKQGGIADKGPDMSKKFEPRSAPEAAIRYESMNHLVISGAMFHYEDNHPLYRIPRGFPYKQGMASVYNGKVSIQFFPRGLGTDDQASGWNLEKPSDSFVHSPQLTPLTITFRGMDPTIQPFDLNVLKRTGQSISIEGAPCDEYLIQDNETHSVHLWIDPQKNFITRRISFVKSGKVWRETDIDYRKNATMSWIPSSWTISFFNDQGQTTQSWMVTIESIRFNEMVADRLFDVEFPEGCRVYDQRTGKYYRVLSDGNMKEIGRNGEDLPDRIPRPSDSWYRRNKITLIGCISSAFVIFYLLRRNRRRFRHLPHQIPNKDRPSLCLGLRFDSL